MQSRLLTKTQELVSTCGEPILTISQRSGIPLNWLYSFKNGRCEKPNVVYVEALYVYLSGKTLEFVE